MRILFLAHQFFPEHYAGTEVLTLGLAKELKARGHEPQVFAAKRSRPIHDMEPGEIEDYEYAGIPVRRVGRPTEGLRRPYRLDYENETMAERAREYAREIWPDVVHAMHLQGLSASVVPALKGMGLPVVYTATDFWAVCPVVDLMRHDGVMCSGPDIAHCPRCILSRQPATRLRKAANFTPGLALKIAGRLSETGLAERSLPLRQIRDIKRRPQSIREWLKLVDRIIAPTRLTRNLLSSNGVGDGDIEVSHYGIDVSDIMEAPRNENVPPPLRVGFIGTLGYHKGADILVRAFKRLPEDLDATLTIYGNLERFESFVKGLRDLIGGDPRITLAGTFPPERIGHVLADMDILVVPSRWYENTPLVVYSAFAAGTPVVATNLGGLSEVVRHGENGLLFGLGDDDDLSRQLRRLCEEPDLLTRLRAGIGHVKTVEENVTELEEIYASLAREGTS
ncbi:MAG TPA: glycosyltransferase family 4 protein [Rubrobacteraceae bacterium]|nr:glycosyltransferase family 4 protein [Rubrobacteraceae bacterium]